MEREDKIAFSVILVIVCGILFGLMWGVHLVGSSVFGWFDAADAGVGFKSSLIAAVVISTIFIIFFSIVAGDGLVGELPTVVIGFFLLTAFFTFSIAWIF
jgi:hypothetical protein